jgi:hypothetical protein
MFHISDVVLPLLYPHPFKNIQNILPKNTKNTKNTIISPQKIMEWKEALGTSREQVVELIPAVTLLIKQCLLQTLPPSQILSSDFHPQLASLLGKIMKVRIEEWRNLAIENQVSPAKLTDFNFRTNTTTATDQISDTSSSSLILTLDIQAVPTVKNQMPITESVKLELSHQEVQTLLDGMLKIRDQLSAIQ